ncbi:MAG: hypothetical protein AAB037_04350 [Chloroflexota bacterium]
MRISELEKIVRASVVGNPMQPALASVAASGQAGLSLPEEFRTALNTLSGRGQTQSKEGSILSKTLEAWS